MTARVYGVCNFFPVCDWPVCVPKTTLAEPLTFEWLLMNERPLSPHLQVYRLPLTAWLSITHRATGVFLSLGMILLVILLLAVAQGPESFASIRSFLQSFIGRLLLWGWIYSLLLHLCHGLRHLIWDTGHGFERETLNRFAAYELMASVILVTLVLVLVPFKS